MSMRVNQFRKKLNQKVNGLDLQIFKAVPCDSPLELFDTRRNSLLNTSLKGLKDVLQKVEFIFQS